MQVAVSDNARMRLTSNRTGNLANSGVVVAHVGGAPSTGLIFNNTTPEINTVAAGGLAGQ